MSHKPFVTGALLLAFAGGAPAAELLTPTLQATLNVGDDYECSVLNAGSKPIEVVVQIKTITNTVLADTGPSPVIVGPGQGSPFAAYNDTTAVAIAYCKVTGKFSKNKVRVSFCVEPQGTNDCKGLAFAP